MFYAWPILHVCLQTSDWVQVLCVGSDVYNALPFMVRCTRCCFIFIFVIKTLDLVIQNLSNISAIF